MLSLYAKALTHKPLQATSKRGDPFAIPSLPKIECEKIVSIHPKHCNAYHKLTRWKPSLAALIHPNYVQTLSLPMQLSMMVNKAFPFSPMGIVHVANKIAVHRLAEQTDSLQLRTRFGRVYIHRKGWLFEVITLASSARYKDSKVPQIMATSYYLARAKHASDIEISPEHEVPKWIVNYGHTLNSQTPSGMQSQVLDFSASIGRQYAKVSGDYNPIHLHQLVAKLFGFKKAIAHGMYSKALAISNIARDHHFYKGSFEIDTVFMQAISLPSEATLSYDASDNKTCDFALSSTSSHKERAFLIGSIR